MIAILSPTGRALPVSSAEQFRRLVQLRWDYADFVEQPLRDGVTDVQVDVPTTDGRGIRIYHAADGQSISSDDRAYRFEIAEWACTWTSENDDFIMLDIDTDHIVKLAPGLTASELEAMEQPADWDKLTS